MKVAIKHKAVYVADGKLPVGVVDLDDETAKGLIARGLADEYAEPVVTKVESKKKVNTDK